MSAVSTWTTQGDKVRKAIYAGSFDPPTRGHLAMIEIGAKQYDELYVLIATNTRKKPLFTTEERFSILNGIFCRPCNVAVVTLGNDYTVRFAAQFGAEYLLRGIRSYTDLESEGVLREAQENLARDLMLPVPQTVFIQLPFDKSITSSTMVKELIGSAEKPIEGWESAVARYVPLATLEALKKKFNTDR